MSPSRATPGNNPSRQSASDIEVLIECWPDFYFRPEYYIATYLPALLASPQTGTMRERLLISCLDPSIEIIESVKATYEKTRASKIPEKALLHLRKFEFKQADLLNRANAGAFAEYETARADAVHKYEQAVLSRVRTVLADYDYEEARKVFEAAQSPQLGEEYERLVQEHKARQQAELRQQFVNEKILEIQTLLKKYEFRRAEETYALVRDQYLETQYNELVDSAKRRLAKAKSTAEMRAELVHYCFARADAIYQNSTQLTREEYIQLKHPFVRSYIDQQYKTNLSSEQSQALSQPDMNLLIAARAGSGKTTVLAHKAALLIERYDVKPDQILILAFNKKAAAEIRNRVQGQLGIRDFENARTFHSLAYQLIQPQEKLLFDDGNGELSRPALSNFVQALLRSAWTSDLQRQLYQFFRAELRTVKQERTRLNDRDYYIYVRNQRDVALQGEHVKSRGEKYLADFLFEHNIRYDYERAVRWGGHNYRPDFTLYDYELIIEFWGIDEKDPGHHVPSWWETSWKDYYEQMQQKREYWHSRGRPLLEFSVADLRDGREGFEATAEARLSEVGIPCEKLPSAELERRVVRNQVDRLTRLLVQFIQKAKKRMWSSEEVLQRLAGYAADGDRERVFLDLAGRIYSDYQYALRTQNSMDYDDLVMRAAALIEQQSGDCSISLGAHKDRSVKMKDLKWVLIDEYQDFSALFLSVINAIRKFNPQLGLVCVGDDWQAINGFAGSDLYYFTNFTSLFPGSEVPLVTNFRSQKAIVEHGNQVMEGKGIPGKPAPGKAGGKIVHQYVDDIWIESTDGDALADETSGDSRFVFVELSKSGRKIKYGSRNASRYLKACYEIITAPENWQQVATAGSERKDRIRVAILSRTAYWEHVTLSEFEQKLFSCFGPEERHRLGDPREKIRVGTAHSYKGLEADIVIVLRANEGSFPLIHPDNALFRFFGGTEAEILDEERRLFYVAVTRASEKLYLLTEHECESPFLNIMHP